MCSTKLNFEKLIFEGHVSSQFSLHNIPWVRNTLATIYCVLALLSLFLNITVIVALQAHKTLNNITNIFVLVLATSDIIMCGLMLPMQAYMEIFESQNINQAFCIMLYALPGLTMYISCLTILLIAIDRYRMVIYPMATRMSRQLALICVVLVISFSIANLIPVGMNVTSEKLSEKKTICRERWPSSTIRLGYTVYTVLELFVLPLVITAILYSRIFWRLKSRALTKRVSERKSRTNRILVSIVVCFAIFWLPWNCLSLRLEYMLYQKEMAGNVTYRQNQTAQSIIPNFGLNNIDFPIIGVETNFTDSIQLKKNCTPGFNISVSDLANDIPIDNTKLIDLIIKLLPVISGIVNPFLYGWLNDSLRENMIQCFGKCFPKVSIETRKNSMLLENKETNNANHCDPANVRENFIEEQQQLQEEVDPKTTSNQNNHSLILVHEQGPITE